MSQSVEIIEREQEASVQSSPSPSMVTLFGSDDPAEVVKRATATSKALMEVVNGQRLSVSMQGKPYLLVEAWTLLGSMVGVFPVTAWTRPLKDGNRTVGWEARVEARTLGGSVVGSAESMCTRDEKTTKRDGTVIQRWAEADEHALRSMAQTRAVSKALASPLRFIAVLAGFAGTPADEMPPADGDAAPGAPTAPQRGNGAASTKTPCAECARLKLKNKKGYPPVVWGGKTTCDGVTSSGRYVNHPLAAEDIPDPPAQDGDVDPDDIPF